MSSLAQEESRSISENCTWGQRKRFADGKVTVPFGRFLGYDRGEDGNLVLNEDEAKIIRRIYGLFLQGRSPYAIAKVLTSEGILTPAARKPVGIHGQKYPHKREVQRRRPPSEGLYRRFPYQEENQE